MRRVLAGLLLLIQAQPLSGAALCAYDQVTAEHRHCSAPDRKTPADVALTQAGPLFPAHCELSAICASPVLSLRSERVAADFVASQFSAPPGWFAPLEPGLTGPPPAPPPRG